MTTNDIEQFVSLREQLSEEYANIDGEIDALQGQAVELRTRMRELRDRKQLLSKALGSPKSSKSVEKPTSDVEKIVSQAKLADPNVYKLIKLLVEHPGITRANIKKYFRQMDDREFTLLLGKCSKRGLIVNKGTKRDPIWEVA